MIKSTKDKPKQTIRKAFERYSTRVNKPIIMSDALHRDLKLPSQKCYKDHAELKRCIQCLEAEKLLIDKDLEKQQVILENRDKRHRKKYARDPDLRKQDPVTYTINNNVKRLKARQEAYITLISELEAALRALTRMPSLKPVETTKRNMRQRYV